MSRAARAVVAVPLALCLGWLSVHAFNRGKAESLVYDASREMITWPSLRAPRTGVWDWVREDLNSALLLTPGDPTAHETLAVLEMQRLDSLEFLEDADVHLREAVKLRPTSPYTWVNFADLRYRLGELDGRFEASLVAAVRLGPGEPEVQRRVADLGLAGWKEVTTPTRTSIIQAIEWGMRRNAPEMLQIAERRGKLRVACGLASSVSGYMKSGWYPLCESTETDQ
jgi:hypothetical protein